MILRKIDHFSLFVVSLVLFSCAMPQKILLGPEEKQFYETAQLIMTKEEKEIFTHLPDVKSREEFIKEFWDKRDPDPDTEKNEFKEEFFRRIEYANEHFKEGIPGWKTDRGRVYIYLGEPDKIEEYPFVDYPGLRGYIIWIYYDLRVAVEFVDAEGNGLYKMKPVRYGLSEFMSALEGVKKTGIYQKEGSFKRKFIDFELKYDKERKEFVISIPLSSLILKEEEGLLKEEFEFDFWIYSRKGMKLDEFHDAESFAKSKEEVLLLKNVIFAFPYSLKPGSYYVEVVVFGKSSKNKAKKTFKIKA